MSIFEILHELVEHSTLSGNHKAKLHYHVDVNDPEVDAGPEPENVAAPETPEQELARLRAELAAAKAAPVKTDAV